jgi:Voltage gated chloride channel
MFAIELMMPEVSVRTFLPVALATGTATFIARLFVGLDPAFQTPPILAWDHHATSFDALLLYAIVGILTWLGATAFIQGTSWIATSCYCQAKRAWTRFVRLPYHEGRVRHVVVIRDEKVFGVVRINTALHHGLEGTYRREPRGCRQPCFCHRSSGGNHVRGDRKNVEGGGHDGGRQPRKWYRSSRSGPRSHHQRTCCGLCGRERPTVYVRR